MEVYVVKGLLFDFVEAVFVSVAEVFCSHEKAESFVAIQLNEQITYFSGCIEQNEMRSFTVSEDKKFSSAGLNYSYTIYGSFIAEETSHKKCLEHIFLHDVFKLAADDLYVDDRTGLLVSLGRLSIVRRELGE